MHSFRIAIFALALPCLVACSVRSHPDSRPLSTYGKARSSWLSRDFTLLNWNIYKGRRASFADVYAKLAAQADIITLQEASTRPNPNADALQSGRSLTDVLLSRAGAGFQLVHVLKYADGLAGVATGGPVRPEQVISVPSKDAEPLCTLRKSSIITTYRIRGSSQTLMVANTHALNIPGIFFLPQSSFERQIREVADELVKHRGPLIWAGDFNTHDQAKKAALDAQMQRLGLKQVAIDHPQRLLMGKLFPRTLDHIYVRGLNASAHALEHSEASDHAPILLRSKVP